MNLEQPPDLDKEIKKGSRQGAIFDLDVFWALEKTHPDGQSLDNRERAFLLLRSLKKRRPDLEECFYRNGETTNESEKARLETLYSKIEERPKSRMKVALDLFKIEQLASGELTWKQLRVLAVIKSVFGREQRCALIRYAVIMARLGGYERVKDAPGELFTVQFRDSVRHTVAALEKKNLLTTSTLHWTDVYYKHWKTPVETFRQAMAEKEREYQEEKREFESKYRLVNTPAQIAAAANKGKIFTMEQLRERLTEEQISFVRKKARYWAGEKGGNYSNTAPKNGAEYYSITLDKYGEPLNIPPGEK